MLNTNDVTRGIYYVKCWALPILKYDINTAAGRRRDDTNLVRNLKILVFGIFVLKGRAEFRYRAVVTIIGAVAT